jgi:hypothetical protein
VYQAVSEHWKNYYVFKFVLYVILL